MNDSRSDKGVQLGCGTLIVIAIIVMVFSGGRDADKLKKSLDELQVKVDRLEMKIDELSKRIEAQPASPRPVEAAR